MRHTINAAPAVTETKTVEITPAVREIQITLNEQEAAHLANILGPRTWKEHRYAGSDEAKLYLSLDEFLRPTTLDYTGRKRLPTYEREQARYQ